MIIFLEGLNVERRNNIAGLLDKDFNVFAIGLIYNRIQKEKFDNTTFNYEATVENLIDMDNITFYLKDKEDLELDNYFDDLILPKSIINVGEKTDEEITKEILDYVSTRLEN